MSATVRPSGPDFATPDEAVRSLVARVAPVGTESVGLQQATGRVLAEPILADRDSPPCDVSAMDGYAVRLSDLGSGTLEIAGEVAIGQEPPPLPPGKTLRIVTGASVPPQAEAVIPREEVGEEPTRITLPARQESPPSGWYIRRRAANLAGGETVLAPGVLVTPAVVMALASFGCTRVCVHRRVRVGVLNTGNEIVPVAATPSPWQIRDANGPGLVAALSRHVWLDTQPARHVVDDFEQVRTELTGLLETCDAVLITGGVSAGPYDFVPDVIASLRGTTVFHRLPIRPGRPLLGAVGPRGQVLLGLPGNPVSTLVTARRFALPVLRTLAGFASPLPPPPSVRLVNSGNETLHVWWYRLVRLVGPGEACLVAMQGSGDIVAQARSDGFVEIPRHTAGPGPWPYYAWES